MENISFQYPTWYILFCLVLGLAYAGILYYRDKTFQEQPSVLIWLMGIFRFITVSILSILLLSPLLKSLKIDTKKPIVVIAQDQSESIVSDMSEEQRNIYQNNLKNLGEELGQEYELRQYAFGNDVREGIDFNYTDKVSNISKLLSNLYDLYSNQNLGAVVLATDGIYNEGSNPVYSGTKLAVPIYTVALGDTTPRRDLILKRVFHNRIAYLGDKFSIQIDITAQNCSGSTSNLNIYKVEQNGQQRLQQEALVVDRNDYFTTKEIILDADKSGVQRYRIVASQISGEVTTANNSKDIFVDVLDARQKILILANSPHPDITAIRQMLSTNKNYQVSVGYIGNLKENVVGFDFVILHQLPSYTNGAGAILTNLRDKKIPRLFIVGSQTNLGKLNQLQDIVTIQSNNRNTNEVQGRIAGDFSAFNLSENINQNLANFAPLTAPFGEFSTAGDAEVLLYQRIGKIDTQYPLLAFGEIDNTKVGVLCAEGIWKWRLFDYLQHQNHNLFNEIFAKSIQYVSLKEDKRKFRASLSKNIFKENEPILIDAELYNNSYELINDPDASLVISSEDGKDFNFVFNKSQNVYTLNAGIFPVGNYTFRASVFSNGEDLQYTGQFSVQPIQLEIYETTADHSLLRLLSDNYGGEMVYPNNLASIRTLIKEKGTVKPVRYETSKTRSLINLKGIFFLLLSLISVEWFLRRYFGGY